ncbi:MAG: HAD family hydrolase [Chryseobacterium sp.]|nr:HAD family hydrolase [Chryseobacterium sp.]
MNKAVFLDRDGTINVDYGYVYKLEDLQIIDKVPESLLRLAEAGFLLIIITNQSGVGRGFFTEEAVDRFNKGLISQLSEKGVKITDVFVCIHSPNQNCDCRKPSPKLILDAIKKYDIDPKRSFMVGDKESDVLSGKNAGLLSFLLDREQDFSIITDKILKLDDE